MTTRSTLTLETLDGRFVPSGTPGTPPETPVQYGDPTPGDDYGDKLPVVPISRNFTVIDFKGVSGAQKMLFTLTFVDGQSMVFQMTVTANATATQIRDGFIAAIGTGATATASGDTAVTVSGAGGNQLKDITFATDAGGQATKPTPTVVDGVTWNGKAVK